MANRKQFISTADRDAELDKLLKAAGEQKVTPQMLAEQRVSFAFGNSPDSERITKETVIRSSKTALLSA